MLSEALFLCRTLEQAASVPVVYATAYYSLVVRGRLRPGESVLIHSGSGGVGQAAIAIALSMRCRVFTTVGEWHTSTPSLNVMSAVWEFFTFTKVDFKITICNDFGKGKI